MRRRYRQVKTNDGYKLVEITNYPDFSSQRDLRDLSVVQRDLNFRSPVDNTVISTHAQLREHNKKHDVVHESEFGSERDRKAFFDRKAQERADFYQGTTKTPYGRKLKRDRINDILTAFQRHDS